MQDAGTDFGDAVGGASENVSPEPWRDSGGELLALLQRAASSKSRACIPCRQLKKRCGTERPCRSCISRGWVFAFAPSCGCERAGCMPQAARHTA